jgi:hypothetical protein
LEQQLLAVANISTIHIHLDGVAPQVEAAEAAIVAESVEVALFHPLDRSLRSYNLPNIRYIILSYRHSF